MVSPDRDPLRPRRYSVREMIVDVYTNLAPLQYPCMCLLHATALRASLTLAIRARRPHLPFLPTVKHDI